VQNFQASSRTTHLFDPLEAIARWRLVGVPALAFALHRIAAKNAGSRALTTVGKVAN